MVSHGRSVLCGAVPRVAPAGRYPAPCLRWSPDFPRGSAPRDRPAIRPRGLGERGQAVKRAALGSPGRTPVFRVQRAPNTRPSGPKCSDPRSDDMPWRSLKTGPARPPPQGARRAARPSGRHTRLTRHRTSPSCHVSPSKPPMSRRSFGSAGPSAPGRNRRRKAASCCSTLPAR